MRFTYTAHFKFRAKQRKISLILARKIYNQASSILFDKLRNYHIAIAELEVRGKRRKLMLAYDRINDMIEFITVHIIREKEIKNKIISGRWRYEN